MAKDDEAISPCKLPDRNHYIEMNNNSSIESDWIRKELVIIDDTLERFSLVQYKELMKTCPSDVVDNQRRFSFYLVKADK